MNKITSTFYLFFLMLLCLGFSQKTFAQVSGDFRSAATGNWGSSTTWQRYDGSVWDASGVGSNNPGQTPTATSSVWIQTAHVVTLTANESCNNLHIATGATAISATLLGKIGLATFTLSVNGKLRDYFATLNTIPGTSTTNGYSIYPFTGTTGKVSIVGTTRTVFNTGEWGATITTPATGIFPLEINFSDNTQVATFATNTKSTSFNLVTGIVSGATISMDNGTIGQGDATIGSGTTLISSGGTVFQRTGSSRAGILTIGGTLKLSGQTPVFAMNLVSNTGTVEYSRAGVQTFIAVISSGVTMTYQNLVVSGSGIKTAALATTVNGNTTVDTGSTLATTNTITVANAPTINGSFQINQGGSATGGTWAYGSTGSLIFNNSSGSYAVGSDVFWPTTSGPANVIVQGAGGITINSAKTILNDLTISSGAVVLNADVAVNNNVTVNSGSITVSADKKLTVKNNIINNAGIAGIIIENNGNLIQDPATTVNANSGAITVKRNSNDLKRLDYTIWSSPVASQNLLAFSPLTTSTRFYSYDNTAGTSGLYSAIADPASTPFTNGAGYLIRMPNEDPSNLGPLSTYATGSASLTYNGVFTGVPNNGDVSVTLNYGVDAAHAYNLVGNPYPSTIDANAFITANTANIESTLYFWRKTNGSGTAYAAYNPAGGVLTYPSTTSGTPNGTIQTGQGFFVQAKSAGLITNFFTNAMRLGTSSTQFFKTKQVVEKDRIWLNLTNTSGVFSQTLVGYITDASLGLDIYDGRYINDSPIALTSNINNEEYTIQGRPTFDASDVVALNFKTDVAGDYSIAIDHTDGLFASGQDVYLVDSTTGAETNLKTEAYTFSAAAGVANARFSLKYQKTLKVDAPTFNNNSVTVYKNKGTLFVNSGAIAINNIKVYDIQGRLIAEQKNVKANSATISNLKATQQVLIVKVTGQDNSVVSKKVVN